MRINRRRKRKLATYMRRNPTKHEQLLRNGLTTGCGVKFASQVLKRGWILDLYSHSARLAVEVDGTSHTSPSARLRDAIRDRVLLSREGIRTLRFTNEEVIQNLPAVVTAIAEVAASRYKD